MTPGLDRDGFAVPTARTPAAAAAAPITGADEAATSDGSGDDENPPFVFNDFVGMEAVDASAAKPLQSDGSGPAAGGDGIEPGGKVLRVESATSIVDSVLESDGPLVDEARTQQVGVLRRSVRCADPSHVGDGTVGR
jgi:hypothetical protein